MLPSEFSPVGYYSDRQLDRARGYRLLAHAEIESYLEDIAKKVVIDAITKWKDSGTPSKTLIAFLASYHSSWNSNNDAENHEIMELAKWRSGPNSFVFEVVNRAQQQFMQKLKGNHGVKEKNIKTLIIPTGIDFAELDQVWLASLDSFGSLRGEVAHNSTSTHGQIDPSNELETVNRILQGLKDLDSSLLSI